MKDDVISRQDAIDEIVAWLKDRMTDKKNGKPLTDRIKDLPSVQKKGHWIDYTEDGYLECPFCGSATNCEDNREELHYCFSCGAELR